MPGRGPQVGAGLLLSSALRGQTGRCRRRKLRTCWQVAWGREELFRDRWFKTRMSDVTSALVRCAPRRGLCPHALAPKVTKSRKRSRPSTRKSLSAGAFPGCAEVADFSGPRRLRPDPPLQFGRRSFPFSHWMSVDASQCMVDGSVPSPHTGLSHVDECVARSLQAEARRVKQLGTRIIFWWEEWSNVLKLN